MKIKNFSKTIFLGLLLIPFVIAKAAELDTIAAVVNTDVITKSELNKKVNTLKRQMANSSETIPNDSKLRQQVLDNIINSSIQLQLARHNNMQISNKELTQIITGIAKNNNMTLAEFKKVLLEKEGVNFKDFSEQIREQVLISRLQQQILGKGITVTDKEIEKVLSNPPKIPTMPVQYHVIDILLETPDDVSDKQLDKIKKTANQMLAKLKKGAVVDKVISDGEKNLDGQVIQQNDLGWRKKDELPELFAEEVVKLKVNQIAGPISAPNGLHLLILTGMNGNQMQAEKLTKEQAQEIVYREKLEQKLKPWLEDERSKAYIKIY